MSVRLWNFKDGGSSTVTFLAKNQHTTKEQILKTSYVRGMSVRQKLGLILESKVVQKMSLDKKVYKKMVT